MGTVRAFARILPQSLAIHVVEMSAEPWVLCNVTVNAVGGTRASQWASSLELRICSCVQNLIIMNTV